MGAGRTNQIGNKSSYWKAKETSHLYIFTCFLIDTLYYFPPFGGRVTRLTRLQIFT